MNKKAANLLVLFFDFLKIGLFTFGGGYAMISLIEREFVARKKWIAPEEFLDMIAIAESTPGPLAINSATYVGYKIAGFWGSLLSTVAVSIPSFVIIYVISLFLDEFLKIQIIANAFKGIQVAVFFLIAGAGIKMFRQMEKTVFPVVLCMSTFAALLVIDVYAWNFSSIYMILIGGALGLVVFAAARIAGRRKGK